jgi:hypothetical protein
MDDDGVMYTGPRDEEPDAADVELHRYEQERERRINSRDQVSWKIIGWVMAAALALLSYDAGGAALEARRTGRPWAYPAGMSLTCGLAFVALVAWVAWRRFGARSGRGSSEEPEHGD